METYHFYLNQRHFFFKNHLISTLKFKSKSREKQLLFIMPFALIMFFPEMNPCPLGLPFTGRSDLAHPHSTRRVVLPGWFHQQKAQLPFLTLGIQQTIFLGHQQRAGESVSSPHGLNSCQVPKWPRPSLKMLNICSSPGTSGYLVWLTPPEDGGLFESGSFQWKNV